MLVLITGGNGGIGYALASLLLTDASHHVLLGARSEEKAKAAVKSFQAEGKPGKVEILLVDVASEESIIAAAKEVEKKHGRLDALVNNAGVGGEGKENMAAEMARDFRTNVIGPQLMMDHFVPLLRKSKGVPRIINVTSGAGSMQERLRISSPRAIPYQVSKSALNAVTLQAYLDYRDEGIKVFLYCPGHCVSNLSYFSKAEYGAKPAVEGARPMVELLTGSRDGDTGKYLTRDGEWAW